ncbi:CbrC family protein [Streptomyces seoulensis]
MSRPLPSFRYHPAPVATGAIVDSGEVCVCCRQSRGWIYTLSLYTEQDVPGQICPWCIADGTAAERFDGEFIDAYGLDGVSWEVLQEVTRRTPAFSAWQDPRWLVHCHDAAAFRGEVGYTELAEHPEALNQLRTDLRMGGWRDTDQLEEFLHNLGHAASAMLFQCTICGDHLAYTDSS